MDIDPIVLLAYISVSINIITMIAACIAYAIFHVRKRRRKAAAGATPGPAGAAVTPIFLRRYAATGSMLVPPPADRTALARPDADAPRAAEPT
jgi:hypothetical protein